jgi:hypothetical protein
LSVVSLQEIIKNSSIAHNSLALTNLNSLSSSDVVGVCVDVWQPVLGFSPLLFLFLMVRSSPAYSRKKTFSGSSSC